MLRPIRLFTDPVLHKPTELVTNFNSEELNQLVQDMLETMIINHGVGLAAPQIGVNKNLCILSVENKTKQMILANLRIIRYSKKDKDTQVEGCLSSPGISVRVKRYKIVEVEGQLLNGEKVQFRFDGFDSRIVQHEIDHCLGKLIVDNVKNIVRR
jgi:peptide deformylase